MITSTLYSPPVYSMGFGSGLLWQVSSNETGQIDFKYVFDIYINGDYVNRIKQRPNPAGYGLIDVTQFASSTMQVGDYLVESPDNTTIYRDGREICGEIHLKVGEEYRGTTGGALVIYNGLGPTAGTPSYWLGPQSDGYLITGTGNTGNVIFTASYDTPYQTWETLKNGFTATSYAYVMQSSTGNGGLFLSNLPDSGVTGVRETDLQDDDRFSLTYWNNNFESNPDGPYVYYMDVTYFDSTGNSVGNTAIYSPGTGTTARNNVMQFACGPRDLNEFGYPVPATATYYEITPVSEDDNAIGETIRVNIVSPDCWGFGRWRFSWLNNLGGRDWFNFVKQNTENLEADRTTYYKLEPYWSGGIYGADTAAVNLYGDTVSNNTITTRYTAMSDWVTPEQSEFLKYLFTSSHVLAWTPDNQGPFLVNILSKSYEVKNYAREKMFNYTIEFTLGQPITAQFA